MLSPDTPTRKLAAIMFTDIAGFTKLSSVDDSKAANLLKTQRDILQPIVEKHSGNWLKEIGDGLLITFSGATSALECAIEIQKATEDIEDLNLRIGIHQGEVIEQDGDIIGDDVNVASRIEPFSAVGGTAISDKVQRDISSNPEFTTKYIGQPKLKGVSQGVKVYCITSHNLPETKLSDVSAKLEKKTRWFKYAVSAVAVIALLTYYFIPKDKEVPSIGILMMENLGIEGDNFWSRGITEDLIVKVAGAGLIRVAPMEEIIRINELSLAIKEKAKALDVKYLLTSSLHKINDKFDLRCQLIEVESGNSKYANKWSEPIEEAPTIVGKLADNILKSLRVSTKQEITKAPTTNSEAYEFYLKGKYRHDKRENLEDMEIARGLLRKAIELDENLIDARIMMGWSYAMLGDSDKSKEILDNALKLAENISDKNGISSSLLYLGGTYEIKGDIVNAMEYYERSVTIGEELGNKNSVAFGLIAIGVGHRMAGDYDEAFKYFDKSLANYKQLGDKLGISHSLINLALAYMNIGDYDKSLDCLNECLDIREKVGEKRKIIAPLNFLSKLYINIGDYKTAMNYCIKSLNLGTKIGNKWGIGLSFSYTGKIHYYKGDFSRAAQTFKKALDIWRELENKSQEIIVLSWMILSELKSNIHNQQNKLNVISKLLSDNEISRIHIPEVNWNLYRINIELNNGKNAREHLEIAYKEVIKQAGKIQSSEDRESFLTNVRLNREIVEEWENPPN